jgi:adenosylcobinamide kinase/adenosylcobinamide-phosphate guanylyltransferase
MGRITLILGGARSGKSSYAQSLAEATGKSVIFIATAQALDEEMSTRIQKHQSERPANWETLELPLELASHIHQIKTDVVILDCLTLLLSNLVMQSAKDDLVDEVPFAQAVQKEIEELIKKIRAPERKQDWFIISNEVGLGLVPPYQMGRIYRDWLGWSNQRIAHDADKVILMVAGIPMVVK